MSPAFFKFSAIVSADWPLSTLKITVPSAAELMGVFILSQKTKVETENITTIIKKM